MFEHFMLRCYWSKLQKLVTSFFHWKKWKAQRNDNHQNLKNCLFSIHQTSYFLCSSVYFLCSSVYLLCSFLSSSQCKQSSLNPLHMFNPLFPQIPRLPLILRGSFLILFWYSIFTVGRDSSVAIATRYGLDGPGIESMCGARFSAPVQNQPPIQCVPVLYRG